MDGGNLNVGDHDLWAVVTVTLAAGVLVEPRHGLVSLSPVADRDNHSSLEVTLLSSKITRCAIVLVGLQHEGSTLLGESLNDVGHSSTILLELSLHVERLQGVDLVLVTRTVAIRVDTPDVLAASTSVAVPVMTFVIWCVTGVWGHVPSVLVGLHDIHLWTPLTTTFVGVTVVVATIAWRRISVHVYTWHAHQVKSGVAAAVRLGEVHIVLNRSSKEIWCVEPISLPSLVEVLCGKVDSIVVWGINTILILVGFGVWASSSEEVQGLTIFHDGDGGVSQGGSAQRCNGCKFGKHF